MNIKIVLLAISAVTLASCSTAYKSGQTPDDVYYSPARVVEENSRIDNRDEVDNMDYEERQIRMSTYDRRWRNLDYDYNYDYTYSPYLYGYSYGYYYNPYYYPCPVYIKGVTISNPVTTIPRMTNLRSYANTSTVVYNQRAGAVAQPGTRVYNNSNNRASNNVIRRILTPTNNNRSATDNNTNTNNNNNTRTYTPSSSSSSTSSGSNSGSISRPVRN
jgi:hypothetical protein